MKQDSNNWDLEYQRGGIPSSTRREPSGVLLWLLVNWPYLAETDLPSSAIDVGCGTGRNSLYLSSLGVSVVGFDSSEVALQSARERLAEQAVECAPQFLLHDLGAGIPAESGSFDLVLDIFVYKHQVDPEVRASYRNELRRVLRPNGKLLVSLAEKEDGFYGSCPPLFLEYSGNPRAVLDPVAQVGSVLFTANELSAEMNDTFEPEMLWLKRKENIMHGKQYLRSTLATVWRLK